MIRVASLPMYDFPWLAEAHNALWASLRTSLRAAGVADVPEALDGARPPRAIWRDPALLLGQTCGYPLLTELAGVLQVVATPIYELPGCDGALHRSFVVVRADDPAQSLAALRGRRCAVNSRDSNTGMNLLRALVASLAGGRPFFASIVETGAHLDSLRSVREGLADVAAIDCVTHGLAARHMPALLDGTRVLTATEANPGPPFVTAAETSSADVGDMRTALNETAASPVASELGLSGITVLALDSYAPVLAFERSAASAGYPALA